MNSQFQEWDDASADRKFTRTFNVILTEDGNKEETVYIDKASKTAMRVYNKNGAMRLAKTNPFYRFYPSGWYNAKEGFVYLERRIVKSFKQGVAPETYHAYSEYGQALPINDDIFIHLHEPVKIDLEKAIEERGPVSSLFYFSKEDIFLGMKSIGFRNKHVCYVPDLYKQEIKDALVNSRFQLEFR